MKILIVEDEPQLLDAISRYLTGEGYTCDTASDYPMALDKILSADYDCIVLDITIPHGSGLQVIENLKLTNSGAGVIIVSAKNSLDDKLNGLHLGADDYMTKPFHMTELNSRIHALLRRNKFTGNKIIQFNGIKLDTSSRRSWVHEKEMILTVKEFDLLMYFLANKNRVISKSAIVEHLWQDTIDHSDTYNFLYTHIKNLRRKLVEKGSPDYIQTVYGIGYNFKTI